MCRRTTPRLVKPNFDTGNLGKLECTMTRISAYFKKDEKIGGKQTPEEKMYSSKSVTKQKVQKPQ